YDLERGLTRAHQHQIVRLFTSEICSQHLCRAGSRKPGGFTPACSLSGLPTLSRLNVLTNSFLRLEIGSRSLRLLGLGVRTTIRFGILNNMNGTISRKRCDFSAAQPIPRKLSQCQSTQA